jgi:hypothetical protein
MEKNTERDELVAAIGATDMMGCGCCAASTEVQTGPEEWDVDWLDRSEVLADAILAAGYRKQQAVIEAVKALHAKTAWKYGQPRYAGSDELCEWCGTVYPCATIEALEAKP